MKTHKDLYEKIYSKKNLVLAWKKARKQKTKKDYVIEFEEDLVNNINQLHKELKEQIYSPRNLKTFVIRDPKTRKISKAHFRDRVIHHALCNIIDPIFDKTFIYDNCANRKCKGSLFALERFNLFKRKVTNNFSIESYCLKADIKHYFQEIDHQILFYIIEKKIVCEKTLQFIKKIIERESQTLIKKGMPLGNLTSQFFANVYLNKLDHFVKHKLKVKYYMRYVDDFVIFNSSKKQLKICKKQIQEFLKKN